MEPLLEDPYTGHRHILCGSAINSIWLCWAGCWQAEKRFFPVFEERALAGRVTGLAAEILSRGNYIVTDSEENLAMVSRQKGLETDGQKEYSAL